MPYIYILASINRVLYVGSTDDVQQRVIDHRAGRGATFTKKYRVHRLVYFEAVGSRGAAMKRELEIKAWRREKKVVLIESVNPDWKELNPPTSSEELDRLWGEEAERRYDEFLAGRAKAYPAEEVFARIRARKK